MSLSSPNVSVIVPAYNCGAHIEQALGSIFSQGIEDIEVVVVDDGSTDDTTTRAVICDPRVRLLRSDHGGPAAARNRAVAEARSEWLAFLDADDLWLPGKLKAQMDYLAAHPDCRVLYSGFQFWHPDAEGNFPPPETIPWSNQGGITPTLSGWIYPELLLESHIHIITALIHRSVFDKVNGFDGSFGKGSDYDFWIRTARHFPAYRLNRDTALYRIHPAGITQRVTTICAGYELLNRAVQQYGVTGPDGRAGDAARVQRHMARICLDHAHTHFRRGDAAIAARFFRRAIALGQRDVKTWIYAGLAMLKSLRPA